MLHRVEPVHERALEFDEPSWIRFRDEVGVVGRRVCMRGRPDGGEDVGRGPRGACHPERGKDPQLALRPSLAWCQRAVAVSKGASLANTMINARKAIAANGVARVAYVASRGARGRDQFGNLSGGLHTVFRCFMVIRALAAMLADCYHKAGRYHVANTITRMPHRRHPSATRSRQRGAEMTSSPTTSIDQVGLET